MWSWCFDISYGGPLRTFQNTKRAMDVRVWRENGENSRRMRVSFVATVKCHKTSVVSFIKGLGTAVAGEGGGRSGDGDGERRKERR